jgi:hypothetical protein
MDGHIGSSLSDLALHLPNKQTLAANRREGALVAVPSCPYGSNLNVDVIGYRSNQLCDDAGLTQRQPGSSTRNYKAAGRHVRTGLFTVVELEQRPQRLEFGPTQIARLTQRCVEDLRH